MRAPGTDSEGKTLTIPRSITFSGRIGSCERLLVEGVVETDLDGCRALALAPGGVFMGGADIEVADISGTVEGTLTVRGIPTVRASGRIRGETISYGELVIERGGKPFRAARRSGSRTRNTRTTQTGASGPFTRRGRAASRHRAPRGTRRSPVPSPRHTPTGMGP